MKRIISLLAVMAIMAAMVVAMAAPAFASNTGPEGGGPPIASGNFKGGTVVVHCKAIHPEGGGEDLKGAQVEHRDGKVNQNCR